MLLPNRQLKKLWEILEIIRNWKSCDQNKDKQWDKITRIETISDWTINNEKVGYFELNKNDKEKFSIYKWDILFSHINSPIHIWKVAIAKKDYDDLFHWMNLLLLRWNKDIINAEYLYAALNWYFRKWDRERICKKAINQASLNQKNIIEKEIPLPPLATQHVIVDALDHASAQITASRTAVQYQLDALDQLWQSTLSEVFQKIEAKKVNLWDVVTIIGWWTPSKANKSYYENGTIPWASVRDMKEDLIKQTELSITEEWLKNSSSNIISKESIIIATRVWLWKVCYINQDTAVNQDLKWLTPKKELDRVFLFWFMKSIANIIIAQWTWATVQWVKLDFIKNLQIPLPDLTTQTSIVSHLDDVSQHISLLKTQYLTQLQSYDDLWASILDQAFRGELI